MNSNPAGWFEIPTEDMDRAMSFYSTVFGWDLKLNLNGPLKMAMFPSNPSAPGADGALVHLPEFYQPSAEGTLIYLVSSTDDVNDELSRVEAMGGKILIPKRQISPEIGYMALIMDCEGNRIGLLSKN